MILKYLEACSPHQGHQYLQIELTLDVEMTSFCHQRYHKLHQGIFLKRVNEKSSNVTEKLKKVLQNDFVNRMRII